MAELMVARPESTVNQERGAAATEYAVLVATMAGVVLAVTTVLSGKLTDVIVNIFIGI